MSYINDALRKVQREKGSDYASCSDKIFDGEKRPVTRRKRLPVVLGITIVVFIATVLMAACLWQEMKRGSRPQIAAVVQVPPVVTVQPLPAEVAEVVSSDVSQETSRAVPGGVLSDAVAVSPEEVQPVPAGSEVLPAEVKKDGQDAGIPVNANKKDVSRPAPASPKVLYGQALKKHRAGRLKEAAALYQEVIKADPRHFSALNNLGVLWMNRKMYKQAVGSFNQALNVKPNYVDARYNLACLYARKNDQKQSLKNLKKAIDLNPEVRQWAMQDHDLEILANLPEFNQLVRTEGN